MKRGLKRNMVAQDVTSETSTKKSKPSGKFKWLKEVEMSKALIEQIIEEQVNRTLRSSGVLPRNSSITCTLPGADVIKIKVKNLSNSKDEGLVCEVF